MRKLVLFSIFLLCGCGVVHQAQLNSSAKRAESEIQEKCSFYMHVAPQEAQAWIAVGKKSMQCSADIPQPWPKDKMMEISQCFAAILDEHVKPVTYSPLAYASYMQDRLQSHKQYAEGKIGWDALGMSSAERMQTYFKTGEGGSYLNFTNCGNAVLAQEVLPNYQYKPVLMTYMSDMMEFARAADKQSMEPEDFAIGAQRKWTEFVAREQQVISQHQAHNSAAWQQTFQNLSTMQQIENQRLEAQRASMPQIKNTNCRAVGNNLECTTW